MTTLGFKILLVFWQEKGWCVTDLKMSWAQSLSGELQEASGKGVYHTVHWDQSLKALCPAKVEEQLKDQDSIVPRCGTKLCSSRGGSASGGEGQETSPGASMAGFSSWNVPQPGRLSCSLLQSLITTHFTDHFFVFTSLQITKYSYKENLIRMKEASIKAPFVTVLELSILEGQKVFKDYF